VQIENLYSELLNSMLAPRQKNSIEDNFNQDFNIFQDKKSDSLNKEEEMNDEFYNMRQKSSFHFMSDNNNCFFSDPKAVDHNNQVNFEYLRDLHDHRSLDYLTMACSADLQNNHQVINQNQFSDRLNNYNGNTSKYMTNNQISESNGCKECKENSDSTSTSKKSVKKKKKVFEIKKISKEKRYLELSYIPFLKKFSPKIIKREVLDKIILRKFRKFLKCKVKSQKLNKYHPGFQFWKEFASKKLLPPMTYKNELESVEFKSYNWMFTTWLIAKNGALDFYSNFVKEKKHNLVQTFKNKVKLEIKGDIEVEFNHIVAYLDNYCEIHTSNYSNYTNSCSILKENTEKTKEIVKEIAKDSTHIKEETRELHSDDFYTEDFMICMPYPFQNDIDDESCSKLNHASSCNGIEKLAEITNVNEDIYYFTNFGMDID